MRVAIVPMRSGSSFKNKNIKLFNGLPLFYHTLKKLNQMIKDNYLDKIIVSSDSEYYLNKVASCFDYGCTRNLYLSIRPKELSTGSSRTEDTIIYELNRHMIYKGVVLIVEVTSPLIPMNALITICKEVEKTEWTNSSFLVCSDIAQRWRMGEGSLWNPLYNKREMRQHDAKIYKEIGAWAIDIENFLKMKERIIKYWKPVEISSYQGISINTEMDFLVAEKLAEINKL